MRRLAITSITPSTSALTPAIIEVASDFASIFHGKQWIDANGNRSPFYTYDNDVGTAIAAPPLGTTLLVATTFQIVGNTKYNGNYTVYTKPSSTGLESSAYNGSTTTTIRVNEAMPLIGSSDPALLSTGFVTNISTYLIGMTGENPQVILENADLSTRPIEFVGRFTSGWGETLQQNQVLLAQNFASATAPVNPFQGQFWFDTTTNLMKVMQTANGSWSIVNNEYFGNPYRHAQPSAANTWTVQHNLNLAAPFIANVQFFVDTSNGIKTIIPSDITFVNANQLTVTFTNAQTGYALIRG